MAQAAVSRTDGLGTCEECGSTFPYYMIHNGFNDSVYAYCCECGRTALLDGWRMPSQLVADLHGPIAPEREYLLEACECGGRFRGSAAPRCPNCRHELSALDAGKWIEANAPGAKQGWHWQRSWRGVYAIIICDRVVNNNWRAVNGAI